MVRTRTWQARSDQEDTKLARLICGNRLHTLQWGNTLRTVFAKKEEESAKRDERRCWEKEEQMQ
jgi:hypothetical protein